VGPLSSLGVGWGPFTALVGPLPSSLGPLPLLLGVGGPVGCGLGVVGTAVVVEGRWWGRRRRHWALAALLGVAWAVLRPPSSLGVFRASVGPSSSWLGVGGPVGRGGAVIIVVGRWPPCWRWRGHRRLRGPRRPVLPSRSSSFASSPCPCPCPLSSSSLPLPVVVFPLSWFPVSVVVFPFRAVVAFIRLPRRPHSSRPGCPCSGLCPPSPCRPHPSPLVAVALFAFVWHEGAGKKPTSV
jgi:hypothetical protein